MHRIKHNKYIGIDGCKVGWFYVGIDNNGECEFGCFKTLEELWQKNKKDALVLIDIPIGLPSKAIPDRQCDTLARRLLSPYRHSSIFSPPCRETLSQKSYDTALQVNKKIINKAITKQAWGIAPKIAEADQFLRKHPKARVFIRECHPEVCFYGLNRNRPMEHYKKESEGREERLELLNAHFEKSSIIFKAAMDRFKRKDVAGDDIIDALAACITGFLSKGSLITIPDKPEMDEQGMPMEMVYFSVVKTTEKEKAMGSLIIDLLNKSGSSEQVFPATELFNETWMLRIVMDWFSKNKIPQHPLNFSKGCRWFSEGLIPTQFKHRSQKDKLAETRTHVDCIVGHFEVGQKGQTDIQLLLKASHLICIEGKMFSKLSSGVKNAGYYNQAARTVACMAEMLYQVKRSPRHFKRLAFYVIAPEEQIASGIFKFQLDVKNIHDTVKRRISAYNGEKDQWFEQWFLPTLDHIKIKCLSWETIIKKIVSHGTEFEKNLQTFYNQCLFYNRRKSDLE